MITKPKDGQNVFLMLCYSVIEFESKVFVLFVRVSLP